MIDLTTLTSKVIVNMGLREENIDSQFKQKISSNVQSAVLEFKAAGIIDEAITCEMGVTAIAIVCNDLLNMDSGNVTISKAYMYYVPILQMLTKEDIENEI